MHQMQENAFEQGKIVSGMSTGQESGTSFS